MSATGPSYDILGFSVGGSSPVDGLVHLPLRENLTALYGLNGVGKSRILSLVEMALTGFVDDEDLGDEDDQDRRDSSTFDAHLQVHERSGTADEGLLLPPALGETVATAVRRLQDGLGLGSGPTDPRYVGLRGLVDLRLLQLHRRYQEAVERASVEGEVGELLQQLDMGLEVWAHALNEAVARGRLTLRAHGTAAQPSWMVYLSLSSKDQAGALALARAEGWLADTRRQARLREPRPKLDTREPLGMESWRYLSGGSNRAEQVPMVKVGLVSAELDEDVYVPDSGRRRRLRSTRQGFRLVDMVGPRLDTADLDAETLDDLLASTGRIDAGFLDSDGSVDESVAHEISVRSRMADELLSQVLPGSPRLSFKVGHPEDWVRGIPPGWYADDVHISRMPYSQQGWARQVIGLANVCRRDAGVNDAAFEAARPRPLLLLCDEPERGLHRLLENRLALGVSDAMRRLGGSALMATHAPSMLASPLVNPILVTRNRAGVALRPVGLSVADGASLARSANDLGLNAGDLWALTRLTIVVEGVHDELVFKTLLRDDIDGATAAVLPIHGGARLKSLADAQMIVNGTDAPILIVLDDLDGELASKALAKIRACHSAGEQGALLDALEELRGYGKRNDSLLFLHQFAAAAIKVDGLERVRVHGLSRPDIICYLDTDTILDQRGRWEDLIDMWIAESSPVPAKNIKAWLVRKKMLPAQHEEINERVELASMRMKLESRALHPDLVRLGLLIRELSATGGS